MSSKYRPFAPLAAAAAFATTFSIALLSAAMEPPSAEAGRYEVVQCDRSSREFADARFDRTNGGDYGFLYRCEEDEDANSLQIRSITGAPQGRYGQISWTAPPEGRIVGVDLEARMRSDEGHQARLSLLGADGEEAGRIATGSDAASGFESFGRRLDDAGRAGFGASLHCVARDGCRASEQARNWIRSIELTIEDTKPPQVTAGGSLTSGGWKRGAAALIVNASDAGAGVRAFDIRVNGTAVAPSRTLSCSVIVGTPRVSRMRPCPPSAVAQAEADTGSAPFVDGANTIRICASDYGSGSVPGCVQRTVMIDNAAPDVALTDPDREDPELIRATAVDRHSGLRSGGIAYRPLRGGSWRELPTEIVDGEVRARVDSASEPRGRYLFRATATDVAGNSTSTSSRADGSELILEFPLRQSSRLKASIGGAVKARTGYGVRPRLRAVLRDSEGNPIGGGALEVVERFAPGSSLQPVSRSVRTDTHGRLSVRLTRGPSRAITVAYGGSRRYLPTGARKIRLSVRGSASLDRFPGRVAAGRRVGFHGSVGTHGVEMRKGKLVELQVKGGGVSRYRTVGRAFRTDSRGNWQMRYRFDRFYTHPTRYRFRLKASRERNWPYVTPTFSRARTLKVMPRR